MAGRAKTLVVVSALAAILTTTSGPAVADHDVTDCGDVTLVFARGSGQTLGEREAPAYLGRLADRLDGLSVNAYELGTTNHGGGQYPAVGIGADSGQSIVNLLEAELSWTGGLGGEYRDAVAQGQVELISYLNGRAARCPDELFAVGGYSQGAQVVGNALFGLDRSVRDKIVHVALFGDPKLYLPEGRGPLPPACRGKQYSEWRRGNPRCIVDNGILEARDPYVPDDITSRVGSWCDRDDGICTGNYGSALGAAHKQYADEGAELDAAVAEAAQAFAGRFPDEADGFDTTVIRLAAGDAGLDVVFVLDTTGSMTGRIAAAKAAAADFADVVVGVGGRVALTEYRDVGDDFVARILAPFTNDISTFESALAPTFASGGGDIPEALLTALMTSFNGLTWTDGATKAAVVLTDAGFHDPDLAQGWTIDDVVQRSLEIDPVNVFPVVPSSAVPFYETLAERTAGQVVTDSGATATTLTDLIADVSTRPVVFFDPREYYAAPGDVVAFAAAAYDIDGDILSYDWDFDGDGTIDTTTSTPTVSHVYGTAGNYLAEVRATSSDGGVGSASAPVTVNDVGVADLDPAAPTGLTATFIDDTTIELTWQPGIGGGSVDDWSIGTADGKFLGLVNGADMSATIIDVPVGETIVFHVSAVNLTGWSLPATVEIRGDVGSDVVTVDPARLLDTRSNGETIDSKFEAAGKVQAGTFTKVQIAGRGGVPADAVGVELNITGIQNEGRGFATLYPCTATRPTASTLNYTPGVNIANATTVALNTNGEVCLYSNETAHYALDVVAYIT